MTSGSEASFRKAATIATDGIRPAVQVERGTVGTKVQFDIEAGGDQHIQVLTREGVHVAGTAALTNSQANNLMSLDSGFGAGGYSNTYLNQIGSASYLDMAIEFGTRSAEQQVKPSCRLSERRQSMSRVSADARRI